MGTTTGLVVVALTALAVAALVGVVAAFARNRDTGVVRGLADDLDRSLDRVGREIADAIGQRAPEVRIPSRAVHVTLDLEEALRLTAAQAAALPGMDAGSVRVDRHDGSIAQQTVGLLSGVTGLEGPLEPPDRTGWEAVTLQWLRYPNGDASEGIRTGVVVPVVYDAEQIGLLGAYTRSASSPSQAVLDELLAIADGYAPTLAAAREHEATKELVRTDPLTGLLNRRGLDEVLAREVARAQRTGAPLTLLMLDLDHFKRVNAIAYRHGDEVLQLFADVIRDACRATDIPGRRGGEEFTVILPDTQCTEARRLDARIRALVSTTEFPHVGRMTYSAGITELRPQDTVATIDERLSRLVNQVKEAGRDGTRDDCGPGRVPDIGPTGHPGPDMPPPVPPGWQPA